MIFQNPRKNQKITRKILSKTIDFERKKIYTINKSYIQEVIYMKKAVSVLLAVILSFSALAVSAGAVQDYQTYYMQYDVRDYQLQIVPLEGYTQYVLPGEDFQFTVQANDGYSTTFVIVEVDMVRIEPDVHGVYTISDINSDHTITTYLSTQVGQSNLFASLIVLVHNILAWFKNIVETFIKGIQT